MELDLQSFFGLHVKTFTHWLRSRKKTRIWAHIRGRYMGQPESLCDPMVRTHYENIQCLIINSAFVLGLYCDWIHDHLLPQLRGVGRNQSHSPARPRYTVRNSGAPTLCCYTVKTLVYFVPYSCKVLEIQSAL